MTSSPPPLMPIERPLCPRCRTRMMLARISPAPDHKEKRVFECPKCNFIDTVTVLDPLKSESTGWLLSELRPPE
jgi:transposase-like protein